MAKSKAGKLPSTVSGSVPKLRQFVLNRYEDASGTSGCGIVATGALFPSGLCVMEWTTVVKSVGVYHSIADVEAIHGHGGMTKLEWIT